MTRRNDNYQFRQGKQYALDVLMDAQKTLTEPSLIDDLLDNLRNGCANKPPSFAEGVTQVVGWVEAWKA